MSWVSVLEDKIKQFENSTFEPLCRSEEQWASINPEERLSALVELDKQRVRQFISEARSIIDDLRSCLDLATDPSIDLAREVLSCRKRLVDLEGKQSTLLIEVQQQNARIETLNAENQSLQTILIGTQKKTRDLERKCSVLEAEIQRLSADDYMMDVYERYTTPDRIRAGKPNR